MQSTRQNLVVQGTFYDDYAVERTFAPLFGSDGSLLLLRHKNVLDDLFSSTFASTGIENPRDPLSANTFSIIGAIDHTLLQNENGRYEFELKYSYDDGTSDTLRWSQASWLTEADVVDADLSRVSDSQSDSLNGGFRGLARSSVVSKTYLDGSPHSDSWWHAVGAMALLSGGVPGHEGKIAIGYELWSHQGAQPRCVYGLTYMFVFMPCYRIN